MTDKVFILTEEQRHTLGSLIAHTLGSECLDQLYNELHTEFRESGRKPWTDITIVKRQYRSDDNKIAILGKVYQDCPDSHKYDYALGMVNK